MGIALCIVLLMALVGCVIPPSLSVEADAGVNAPPAILSVTGDQAEFPEPGPVAVERGEMAGNVKVSLIDTDVGDKLYVRIFVNYNLPDRLPPRVACMAAPNMTPLRTATCNLAGLCAMPDVGVQQNMTVVVFDRMPADIGADPQMMMDTTGLSTSRFYFLSCQQPQT
ncbi:MAG TPA: hypothetical protein VF469_28220 [Kofleriaceae bacterium]